MKKHMKIILCLWAEGGTGLTNFRKEELPKYEKVLELTDDPDYVICSKPCATAYYSVEQLENTNHSLHCLVNKNSHSFYQNLKLCTKST